MGGALLIANAAGSIVNVAQAVESSVGGTKSSVAGTCRLALENLHTGDRLNLVYAANGAYEPDALKEINHVLRDHRTGEVHAIDTGLLDLLHNISATLETTAPFQDMSGYRSPVTNAALHGKSSQVATKSLHMVGQAIDIRVPGRALTDLHKTALGLKRGGVGFYPSSNFVHVDVGRVRKWSGA
jgi:uncharacterized protein YcbK (DUF882 family)